MECQGSEQPGWNSGVGSTSNPKKRGNLGEVMNFQPSPPRIPKGIKGISSLYSRSGLNQNYFGSLLPKGWENQAQAGIILNPIFSWLWEEPRGDKADFPQQILAAPSGNLVPLLPPASSILSGIGIGNAVPGRAALAGRCPGTIPLRGTYQDLPLWARKIKGEKDKKKKQEKETGQGRGRKRQERERAGSTKKGGKSGKTAEENPLHAINGHSQR